MLYFFVWLVLYCTFMSVPLKRKLYYLLQLFDEEILVFDQAACASDGKLYSLHDINLLKKGIHL